MPCSSARARRRRSRPVSTNCAAEVGLVLVGAGMEQPVLDPNRVLLNELEICGSFVYDADGFERALELLGSGVLPVDVLVEHEDVTLDRLPDALDGLFRGRIAGKVMVVPRTSGEEVPA